MTTLFDYKDSYPNSPGYKKRDTAKRAAKEMKEQAPSLRDRCLKVIRDHPNGITADLVAKALGKSVLSVRPRVTELAAKGLIVDSGRRGKNSSGKRAISWKVPA